LTGCYVYILEGMLGNEPRYYVGVTNDLDRRMQEHLSGKRGYTKRLKNLELRAYTSFNNKSWAMKVEYKVKHMSRADKLELIECWGFGTL